MKLATACVECRAGKRKCTTLALDSSCRPCMKRHIECSLQRVSQQRRFLLPASMPNVLATGSKTQMPCQEVREELTGLYLRYLHNKPHSLFHEPTLLADVRNDTISHNILFGILGLSARFSPDPEIRSCGNAYSIKAKRCVKDSIDDICLENIQACILVGTICSADDDVRAESIYYSVANTMAQILQISSEDESSDTITRETKRRVWWSLYMIDTWSTAGIDLPRRLHFRGSGPQLPMDESMFNNLQIGDLSPDKTLWKPGFWAHMVILVQIHGRILDLNRRIVFPSQGTEPSIEEESQSLASELENFERNLPEFMRYSLTNLRTHIENSTGRMFVALHMGYHHYSTLLYYHYLEDHNKANFTETSREFIRRCKYHARALSDLIRESLANTEAEAAYYAVGHMTVVSSSVLVHTLLFGDASEVTEAREMLEVNFRLLVHLGGLWPSIVPMINRLVTFQNFCLETATPQPHKIDKWMIKFLLQHAVVLDGRENSQLQSHSFQDLADVVAASSNEELLKRTGLTEEIFRGAQLGPRASWN